MAKRLLYLNGLAIIGVILNHSVSRGFISMFWWTDRYMSVSVPNFDQIGNISYYSLRVIEQVITFSVPAFLFVSGYFISFAIGRNLAFEGWKVAKPRIVILLIPYIIWSIIMFAFSYMLGTSYSPLTYLKLLATGGAANPYYFIPLLIQLFLLAPLFIIAARKNWILLLSITAIIQLAVQSFRYPVFLGIASPIVNNVVNMTPSWFFPGKMFWFVLGIVVNLHLVSFKQWLARYREVLLGVLIILFFVGIIEWEIIIHASNKDWVGYYDTSIDSLYAFVFILCFISFDKIKLPFSQKVQFLGGQSYGIYLTHILVLTITSKIVYNIAPAVLAHQYLLQPLLVSLGLGIPILLMTIVRKSPARNYYQYLFG